MIKLSKVDVDNVRASVASGISQERLAEMYGVSQSTISRCVMGTYVVKQEQERLPAHVVDGIIGEVHKKHDRQIRMIASGFSTEHVDDIVQETYVRLVAEAGSFNCDRSELGVWARVVARSVGKDYLKAGAYKMAELGTPLSHLVIDGTDSEEGDDGADMFDLAALSDITSDPYEVMVAEETAGILNDALGSLNPVQCLCYTMREVDGMSYVDIADEIGATEAFVRKNVGRAQAALLRNITSNL